MAQQTINVPIGAAVVEFGEGADLVVFDITKGGINFTVNTSKQDVTVDQYGDTPVKSILKGRTCQTTVPFALHDLVKLSKVTPNSVLLEDGTDPSKKKLEVYAQSGYDLLGDAKKLVIKPITPGTTANDYITIPMAGAMADPNFAYDSDNERIANITFVGYPDADGLLYFLGDESVAV